MVSTRVLLYGFTIKAVYQILYVYYTHTFNKMQVIFKHTQSNDGLCFWSNSGDF